jgi:S-adenosylmethionine:tRNA ribosyltransferase-isomerase
VSSGSSDTTGGGSFWSGELDYQLPESLIAQSPAARREQSRLMVLDRDGDVAAHSVFSRLGDFLPERALLVANDSRVLPARLRGHKEESGGAVEALMLGVGRGGVAPAMVRVAKPLRVGQAIVFAGGLRAMVVSEPSRGRVSLDFGEIDLVEALGRVGEVPLPPYIGREGGPSEEDRERYQTVYARSPGSVAAPTAGLHFTDELIADLRAGGFDFATLTLHVGPGTFTPVRGTLAEHEMETETYDIPAEVAESVRAAKAEGRAVVAVGTTTVRALESAVDEDGRLRPGAGDTRLFIRPGHRFAVIDALITNFHLPGSTLLALVMALAGRNTMRAAYEDAVRSGYRFYSFGDAMLIR